MRVIYLLLIAILTLPYIANGQVLEFSAPVPAAGICTKNSFDGVPGFRDDIRRAVFRYTVNGNGYYVCARNLSKPTAGRTW